MLLLSINVFTQTYNGDNYRKEISPTKNDILLIADGTSLGVLSSAR
ncbi:hypothetical protein [Plebeiibacterium sediminum]|uniref:Uncharacterized protein n=1 Tax=Plebeiibacterium sediminum TaxID=2992112 RepID=A0AAE3M7G3_9BACT|nr:hypothetical protein [Plebeiobacterium sediminum]MCW3787945.1 hypothetical protein [Plebeiobacterium sediminum]